MHQLRGLCPELDRVLDLLACASHRTPAPDGYSLSGVLLLGAGAQVRVLVPDDSPQLLLECPNRRTTERLHEALALALSPARDGWTLSVPITPLAA